MNCKNCGGPLTLAPGKNYEFCEFCGTFHFPESASDTLIILEDEADERQCPVCLDPLAPAAVAGCRVLHCRNCRGILLYTSTFLEIVEALKKSVDGPAGPPQPIDPAEFDRIVKCPECGERMETHPYLGPGNVVIDSCGPCRLVWLDHGELEIVVDAHSRRR